MGMFITLFAFLWKIYEDNKRMSGKFRDYKMKVNKRALV